MALRLKKDIKKSSYYVWFLGAQESRGLRGDEYALPAIDHLERRARDLEPFKVTLQVSHKGLKIIQNVAPKGKQQTIKHFIPHSSITSAVQQGDVVAVVLLLFNPVTSCPIHVHAYRCDSDRTAEILCAHLQALIDKPENQKKFADIERKLQSKGALPTPKKIPDSSLGSEVSTRESESGSSEERCVATLYDSLAAELKQKLSTGKSPILLPPRDYDTVHRQKGNLSGIDTRRCLNQNIVGVNARRKLESSGGSSGIGSDLAPSPDQNEYPRQHDNQSTSEEDWAESTAYMMHEGFDVTPPRRAMSPRREMPPSKYQDDRIYRHESLERPSKYSDDVFAYPRRYATRQQSPPVEPLKQINRNSVSMERISNKEASKPEKIVKSSEQNRYNGYNITNNISKMHRGTSEGSLKLADGSISPKDRFNVAKEKFMNLERERFNQELEKHMQIRRNMLEKNNRNSSPDEVKANRVTRKWSQEDDDEDIALERRAELPRVGQRSRENGYRDKTPNRVEPQRFYEYGSDEFYDKRFTNERRRGDIEELEEDRFIQYPEPTKDYRSGKRYDSSENRRSRLDLERRIEDDDVRDSRIEPVIDDRPKRGDPKRASRIDHDRYDPRMNSDEVVARRVPVNDDDWSDHRRGISRTRMLKDHPSSKRHSSYDTEERRNFEVRKSYAEVNNYPDNRYYEPRYRQDVPLRYRDVDERDRYNGLDREPPKIRHSYAEPMARNRVGVAPVRPY